MLSGGIKIPDGADLNNYTTPGNYYCPKDVSIPTLKNCPLNHAFILKVRLSTGEAYPSQEIIEFNSGKKAYRVLYLDNVWQDWIFYVTNTDLQAHWPKVLHFNIEANTYKTIKEQGSNRFSQLLFLQTANTNGYGLYLLSGYGNEGGTNRYYISEIASGSQFNIEVSETSFKVTNSNHSTATVALVSFMGDIPTIQ